MLAAALKRQVWMSRGFYKLYPNIYVLMVAESAKLRKSAAADLGLDIIVEAVPDLYYITDRTTPEGIVQHMNRSKTLIADKTNIRMDSHILIAADELANLFGFDRQMASRMAIFLTRTYMAPGRYLHTTSKDGQTELHNLYPTVIACTEPRNLKVLPEEAIGGLVGRIIFVTSNERRKVIAWPELDDANVGLRRNIVEDLYTISTMQGEMTPTQKAKDFFTDWYNSLAMSTSNDPRLDAFQARCHDTALKIAMLLSVARSDNMVLEVSHVAGGITFIEQQLPAFSRVVNWANASVFAQNKAKFIDLLDRNNGVSSRRIALKVLGINLDEIVLLEDTLQQEHLIQVKVLGGKDVTYKRLISQETSDIPPPNHQSQDTPS